MKIPEPCCTCKHRIYNEMTEKYPDSKILCWLNLPIGIKDCPKYERRPNANDNQAVT